MSGFSCAREVEERNDPTNTEETTAKRTSERNIGDLHIKVGNASKEYCGSLHPRKHFSGVDVLPFLDKQALDFAALGRADFVLHFHCFDNEQALPGFHGVAD